MALDYSELAQKQFHVLHVFGTGALKRREGEKVTSICSSRPSQTHPAVSPGVSSGSNVACVVCFSGDRVWKETHLQTRSGHVPLCAVASFTRLTCGPQVGRVRTRKCWLGGGRGSSRAVPGSFPLFKESPLPCVVRRAGNAGVIRALGQFAQLCPAVAE